MRTPLTKVAFDPRYGVAPRHWTALLDYARREALYLFVRGGKPAAIPWIERGFPGKPLELKIKVDPQSGLLLARDAREREAVFRARHLVLARGPRGLQAVDERGQPLGGRTVPAAERWAVEGAVVDRLSGQPFTSDYDIAAVVPAGGFDYQRDVQGFALDASRTSHLAEQTRRELNQRFGSQRFQHGPQALYDQKLSNSDTDSELIVAFCANGDAYTFRTPASPAAAVMQYRDLLIALHPGQRHVFVQ